MLLFTYMGMLTENDIRLIGRMLDERFGSFEAKMDSKLDKKFDEKFDEFRTEIGTLLEMNFLPQFNEIHEEFGRVRDEMKDMRLSLERRIDRVDGKVNSLVNVLLGKGVIAEDEKAAIL